MTKKFFTIFFLIFLMVFLIVLNNAGTDFLFKNQPKWYFLSLQSYKKFMQVLGTAFGFRALTSDFYYIAFLQYYGDRKMAKVRYKDLIKFFDDITDADPSFEFAYLYGGAILGFNLKRYDEAVYIIKKGITYNPKLWKLRLYLGAIAYKEKEDKEKYIKFLEDAVRFEDRPGIIDRLLGNVYEQIKTPEEVVKYWLKVYKTTKDKWTKEHSYSRLMFYIKERKIKNIEEIIKELK